MIYNISAMVVYDDTIEAIDEEEAKKMLKAKLECMNRFSTGCDLYCTRWMTLKEQSTAMMQKVR